MSTTARKHRKAAGIKFERTPKVGTPLRERGSFRMKKLPARVRAVLALDGLVAAGEYLDLMKKKRGRR